MRTIASMGGAQTLNVAIQKLDQFAHIGQIGGLGADTFDFNAFNESRVGANHDVIKGFKRTENDTIDLKNIDADATAGGNQAFDFIGGSGFSNTAGELRLAGGLLQGDTNGNGIADFEVKVAGIGAGAVGDFVL